MKKLTNPVNLRPLLFFLKGTDMDFSAKSDDWDKFFKGKGSSWRDKDYRYLDSVFDISNFRGSLLDMGCALGDGILYLKGKCSHVTKFYGADISAQAISKCKQNAMLSDVTFFQHDIMNTLNRKLDIVVCLQTLEHVPDPIGAMKNLIDATNCLLIVSTPYKNRRPDSTHLWSFDEHDFRNLVDCYCLGQNSTNIYLLVDKWKHGYSFRNIIGIFVVGSLGRGKSLAHSLLHLLLK